MRIGAPLARQHRRAAEPRRLVPRDLEGVLGDRPAAESARVDVRRVDDVPIAREVRRGALTERRPQRRRLEQNEPAVRPPPAPRRGSRRSPASTVRQRLLLGRREGVRLVHEVVAGDAGFGGEEAGDVPEHARVAGADADPARARCVGPERLKAGEHGRAGLANSGSGAARRRRRPASPTRGAVPAQRRLRPRRALHVRRGGQRRAPGVLMQVDDAVDAARGEERGPPPGRAEVVVVVDAPARARPATTTGGGARCSTRSRPWRPRPSSVNGKVSARSVPFQ